ncbi:lysozyme inhibitor LprI family protein [Ectopseudomonas guguanensis]|uniref:lysozyme inhibitor LprI family protein n=1 Tax=Ectopseudomonas guguanensis TaxID=1198456 RepID=UPI001428D1FF|nr:lysozyme inhibitor LprI family protein [Pseudomonas guguanensis]
MTKLPISVTTVLGIELRRGESPLQHSNHSLRSLGRAKARPLTKRYAHQGLSVRAALVFILTVIFSQFSFADSQDLRSEEKECGERMSYKEISSCFSTLYKKADQELNDQYSNLSNSLDLENRKNLVAAQRLWVKFRDADCAFYEPRKESDNLVSSGRSICLTRRTLDRLEQLESYNFRKGCNGCAW